MRFKLIGLSFLVLLACQESKTIKIRFDSAEKVKTGDVVILQNAKIGAVRSVKMNADKSALVIILFDRPVDVPQGSEFILSYDIFGTPFISIEPSREQDEIDPKVIQRGTVKDFQGDTKAN